MKNFFLILFAATSLFSCQEILDNQRERDEQENYTSPYKGTWIGNYTGQENGTLTLIVAKNGYTEVIKTSQFSDSETFYSGMITDYGALQSVSSQASGFVLYGNLQNKSGTWKKGEWSGNWSLTKQ